MEVLYFCSQVEGIFNMTLIMFAVALFALYSTHFLNKIALCLSVCAPVFNYLFLLLKHLHLHRIDQGSWNVE